MNVLIIEDDRHIQQLLIHTLTEQKHHLIWTVTDSAAEANRLAQEKMFDFFIVDIQLIDYKGTDLVEQLRTIPAYKYTPIIFATAVLTEELRAYRELKCFYYLIKPYTKEEMKRVIDDVLEYLSSFSKEDKKIRIEQKGFIFEYALQQISFVESFGKKLCIHVVRDKVMYEENISGYSLKSMIDLLDERFVQCHKSFLVNTDYIEQINKINNTITLKDGNEPLPIGTKYRNNLI